jgi:cell wall-associated protease
MKKIIFISFSLFFFSCIKKKVFYPLSINENKIPKIDSIFNSKKPIKNWQLKDVFLDSVPGISLNRTYDSLLKNKKGKEIIVAVLDSEIDIECGDLRKYVWKNKREISNNNLDDDKNGYIDDIHGWNFLGNQKGENTNFTSYSYTRILIKYDSLFKGKQKKDINPKDSISFAVYIRALSKYKDMLVYAKEDIDYINMVSNSKSEAEKELSKYFSNKDYLIKDLDSLKEYYPKAKVLQEMILRKSNFIKYGYSDNYIKNYHLKAKERIDKLLNLNFNERKTRGDNPEDLTDINYGNNIVNANINLFTHGTEVSSTIASFKNENIKIMSLVISPFGDEHDKDIALAIRYAVDNGAKVINMSFGKEFSLKRNWINEAFKYAEKNEVLIVAAAGNSSENLNLKKTKFPNDMLSNGKEITDNFLSVGSISNALDKNILSYFTDYGNNYVDLFAPGDDIYTTLPNNNHNFNGGTSLASAITSGAAALLFSYYPNLKASQVKHILMDSGLEYTFDVNTPTKKDQNKTTPFNQLSKSGKVLNVYNAFISAQKE